MNYRFDEIAKQAKIDSLCFDDVHIPDAFIEAFARGLIKECADWTDPVTRKLMFTAYGMNND